MSGSKSSSDFARAISAARAQGRDLVRVRPAPPRFSRRGARGPLRPWRRRCGHAVVAGFAEVLRDDEAAFILYRFRPRLPSAPFPKGPRRGASSMFPSQRIQQEVERKPRAMACLRLRNPQRALVVDRQIDARRNDIHALAFDRHSVGGQQDPTGIEVWPASRSTIMLSWLGSRCCTMMKAMPLTVGSASRTFLQASRPPAKAPIATTGNSTVLRAERGFDIQRDRFPSTI